MTVKSRWTAGLLAVATTLAASVAQAHPFGEHGAGLVDGLVHPFGGVDHLLAMVAVGLWAAQRGGRAVWALPASFMAAMAAGGLLGTAGIGLPMVETGIAASVMVLGAAVALALRPALWFGMATVAAFALFHGHAHGTELPAAASPLLYGLGMLAATAVLHALGVAAARGGLSGFARLGSGGVRIAGAAVAASGLLLVVG
ncbi:HupE/UreJ family protein [Arenibaculum pallidiluteum]|uniref:HupE/UreJ family protein n=1 Tax=Arenibaculum pallidiluteum TaxID=2812559 RepID=UPI001A964F35|nr:HupE/UreJ family protein [Arenibaculum pallidiluteum]